MKDVIEMAKEVGLRSAVLLHMYGKESALCDSEIEELRQLERFAELVRADERNSWPAEMEAMERQVNILTDVLAEERERIKWDVHSCGPTCTKAACVAMREAVKAEREACALICDEIRGTDMKPAWDTAASHCSDAIRARGQQ